MIWKDNFLYPIFSSILKGAFWAISVNRLPKLRGTIPISGIKSSAEVLRDKWGIPHIYANNPIDLMFVQGFSHAQERLWQMDFTRRVVCGRISEILGREGLQIDREMRILGLYRTAQKEAIEVNGKLQSILQAYRDGVNTWIEICVKNRKLPIEFLLLGYTPDFWEVSDSFALGKIMSWILAANWKCELYRSLLSEEIGKEKIADLEGKNNRSGSSAAESRWENRGLKEKISNPDLSQSFFGDSIGSNNWVIHGQKTTTGKPILANDMHLALTVPGIWYENHLSGGELDVTGVSIPGIPLIISGHNNYVAWGYTNSCVDVQDLYKERLKRIQGGGWEYEYKGKWHPVIIRREKIKIKKDDPIIEEVLITQHGPVINGIFENAHPDLPPLALRWTALCPDYSIGAIYKMNIARNCSEFHTGLREFNNPSQNVVYADVYGDIGYTLNGQIPIRNNSDGSVPVPGWTGDNEWLGFIPFNDLPHQINPECGYIATANNKLENHNKPYSLKQEHLIPDRVNRICALIKSEDKINLSFIKKIQIDQVSISAQIMARVLASLQVTDHDQKSIISRMRTWDGNLDKDSDLSCVFEVLIRIGIDLMVDYHLDELGHMACGTSPYSGRWPFHFWKWFINLLDQPDSFWFDLGNGETRDDILRISLRKTVDYLTEKFGPNMDDWKWGYLHHLIFQHQLGGQHPLDKIFNIGPFPIGGDANTIWATHTGLNRLNLETLYGPPFRFIADLDDLDHCFGQLVPGQSGHLASRHYRDGIKKWFVGEYHPMLFNRNDVENNLSKLLTLIPVK